MDNQIKSRRLSAIMFTDIVDYSALMNRNESAAITLLDNKEKIVSPIIKEFDGKTLKKSGDGYLIEFSSAVDAVRCGIKVQKTISEFNSNKDESDNIILRIGIHLGDILIRDNDIFGDGVNIASRIESLAEPGGICITQTVYDQIKNKVEIQTVDLGETELKNITDKVSIYKVLIEAQQTTNESKDKKSKSDDPEVSVDKEIPPKQNDGADIPDMGIPEKVVINDGDEKVDININKAGKEVTINVEKKGEKKADSKKREKVTIGLGGIHVKDGDEEVTIGPGGIKVKEKDGTDVEIGLGGIKVTNGKKKNTNKKKISNFGKSIIKLLSGIAFLVFITGIFGNLYTFWYGVIGAFAFGISAGALKTFLQYNLVKSIFQLMIGFAFLVFITGLFTDLYSFGYGLIGFFAVSILSVSFKSLFGIKDDNKD